MVHQPFIVTNSLLQYRASKLLVSKYMQELLKYMIQKNIYWNDMLTYMINTVYIGKSRHIGHIL